MEWLVNEMGQSTRSIIEEQVNKLKEKDVKRIYMDIEVSKNYAEVVLETVTMKPIKIFNNDQNCLANQQMTATRHDREQYNLVT